MILYTLEVSLFFFACSLSFGFHESRVKNRSRLYWLLVSFLVFMTFNATRLHLWKQVGWQSFPRRKNPCFSLKNHNIILELLFWRGVPMIQCDQLSPSLYRPPPPILLGSQLGTSTILPMKSRIRRMFHRFDKVEIAGICEV